MSQSSTYFHHEAIEGCFSLSEYENKIKNCGDSTTGFLYLSNFIKNKKTVIIKKNNQELQQCISWCDSTYNIDSACFIKNMNEKINQIDGLVINQSEIDDKLTDIWTYLVNDEWKDIYSKLVKMNIRVAQTQINADSVKELHATL